MRDTACAACSTVPQIFPTKSCSICRTIESARVFAPKVAGGWWLHTATDRARSGLVGHLLLGRFTSGLTGARLLCSRELLAGRLGRVSARARVACGRNQLGTMGRGGAGTGVRRSRFLDDHRRAGAGGDEAGARGRSPTHRACSVWTRASGSSPSPRRPVRPCSAHWATRRSAENRGDGWIKAELDALDGGARPGRLAALIADEIKAVLRSAEPIDQDTVARVTRPGLAHGARTSQPARGASGHHASGRACLGIPDDQRVGGRDVRTARLPREPQLRRIAKRRCLIPTWPYFLTLSRPVSCRRRTGPTNHDRSRRTGRPAVAEGA